MVYLFEPEHFDPDRPPAPKFVTNRRPEPNHRWSTAEDTCSDDHLWLVPSVCQYVKETAISPFSMKDSFADGGALPSTSI